MPTSKVSLIPKKAQFLRWIFFLEGLIFFPFFQGKIAYVPQQAWMQNATLKNNILFGRDYKKDLYEKVITFLFFFSNCVYIVWPLTFFEKASINQHLIKASFRTFSITNFSLDKKVCVQKTLRISFFSL